MLISMIITIIKTTTKTPHLLDVLHPVNRQGSHQGGETTVTLLISTQSDSYNTHSTVEDIGAIWGEMKLNDPGN